MIPGVRWAQAAYESPYGPIASHWERTEDRVIWYVTVPANTEARVGIPGVRIGDIWEGGRPVRESRDIRIIGLHRHRVWLRLGSGQYRFAFRDVY